MPRIICILVLLMILLSACNSNIDKQNNQSTKSSSSNIENSLGKDEIIATTKSYKIGRNPNTFILNSDKNRIYFKSYTLINGENRYQGLFSKKIDGTDKKLIYNDFEGSLNIYGESLYFIDTKGKLVEFDLTSQKTKIIAGDNKFHVYAPLIINDILFYNNIDNTDNCNLIGYYIKSKNKIIIEKNTYWRFLSNFREDICFFDNKKTLKTWNATLKKITPHGEFDVEVLKVLDDGSVIGYKDRGFVKVLNGNTENLIRVEDTYNSILIEDNLFISTVDRHNYTQIFRYSLKTKKLVKIATPDFPLIGYSGKYLFCASDSGMGDLQIINTENGDCKTFDERFTAGNV